MKSCNDIDFLDSYWSEAKKVACKIREELPQMTEPHIKSESGTLMYIVKYSDLGNSWSVKDILRKGEGRSQRLTILADKISHMIYKGNADSIKPMIQAIIGGKIRHFSKGLSKEQIKNNDYTNNEDMKVRLIGSNYKKEPLGFGHFRWDNSTHTLTQVELNHIKTYFKI